MDGRNIDGIFPKILTAKDIQIVSIDGENLFGSYCSGLDSKPGHFKCAKGVYETYLILIPYKMGVHKATIYGKFIFMLKASRNIKWNIDNQEKEYNYQESIEISDPTPIPIDKIIPNA